MAPKQRMSESKVLRLPQWELASLLDLWSVQVPKNALDLEKRALLVRAMQQQQQQQPQPSQGLLFYCEIGALMG